MTELQVSTSPRMTWLWAPDEHAAQRVREITSGSSATHRGEALALVTDVGIGVEALAACEELAKAGFTFTWHGSEHPATAGPATSARRFGANVLDHVTPAASAQNDVDVGDHLASELEATSRPCSNWLQK